MQDPSFDKDVDALEMVQRRAAQWVTSNYDQRNGTTITSTLEDLTRSSMPITFAEEADIKS